MPVIRYNRTMAENAAKRTQTAIDPMFFIPEGVDELVYDDTERNLDVEIVEEESEEIYDDVFLVDDTETSNTEAPETPDILSVIEQTLRKTASGNQVVDVVVEVDDIPGISKYEFRVTKI